MDKPRFRTSKDKFGDVAVDDWLVVVSRDSGLAHCGRVTGYGLGGHPEDSILLRDAAGGNFKILAHDVKRYFNFGPNMPKAIALDVPPSRSLPDRYPPVSWQMLHDIGLNPFAVVLLLESFNGRAPHRRQVVSFRLESTERVAGVGVRLEPLEKERRRP